MDSSPHRPFVSVQPMNHPGIERILRDSGTRLGPAEFIRAVSNAYHEVEAPRYDESHPEIRNQVPAVMTALLARANLPPRGLRVLELGSGTGLASGMLLEWGKIRIEQLVCSDISPQMLDVCRTRLAAFPAVTCEVADTTALVRKGQGYDLVMTSSVVHHVADLGAFFDDVLRLVRGGGYYLMLHEPSRRFHENSACQSLAAQYREVRERRRMLRFVDPLAYFRKVAAVLSGRSPRLSVEVNRLLMNRGVIRRELTPREIGQLVDIHDPMVDPDSLGLGTPGFRIDELTSTFLSGFELVASVTYGFLGNTDETTAPDRWRQKARLLAEQYPDDGGTLAALWRKT